MARNVVNLAPPPNTIHRPYIYEATSDAVWSGTNNEWTVTAKRINADGTLATIEAVMLVIGADGDAPPVLEGQRCVMVITANARRALEAIEKIGETVHPWKLRWDGLINFGRVYCYGGLVEFKAWRQVFEGWIDTGTKVQVGSSEIYLLATTITDFGPQALFFWPASFRTGYNIIRAWKIGTVYADGTIEQSRRSDIVDDDRTLTAREPLTMEFSGAILENNVYDGSEAKNLDINLYSQTISDRVIEIIESNIQYIGEQIADSIEHNKTKNKQGGTDQGGVGEDEKEYYHLTKAEYEFLQALMAE